MEWISKYLDVRKIPASLIILVWIICFFLLYLPVEFITKLSLLEFKTEFGKWFGITFLITSALLIMMLLIWFFKGISRIINKKKYRKIAIEAMSNLDEDEQAVLREFIVGNYNALKVPMDNPTVSSLISKGILYRVSNLGGRSRHGVMFSYSVAKVAKELIHSNYELIGLTNREPTEEEIRKIQNSRPEWALKDGLWY